MQVSTIGLDLAKNVFQVHGIDANEKVVVRKQLRRSQVIAFFEALPPCLVGMEACATAHYWARELRMLGHEVRLMPAKDVKAYVKRIPVTEIATSAPGRFCCKSRLRDGRGAPRRFLECRGGRFLPLAPVGAAALTL